MYNGGKRKHVFAGASNGWPQEPQGVPKISTALTPPQAAGVHISGTTHTSWVLLSVQIYEENM
jgi:hypothetical protein